ncbi:hypothetical protein JTE90_010655 [Oedothorax gibbosus]|uniref:Uncharacterized protein n=1 Tax=Oedothorax gibbosus TaxID=931172 RepID=A0AAV6TMR6_9ARAC|nr:hypothetical protein JTE90_010655 [Oedothorax gibbosus]
MDSLHTWDKINPDHKPNTSTFWPMQSVFMSRLKRAQHAGQSQKKNLRPLAKQSKVGDVQCPSSTNQDLLEKKGYGHLAEKVLCDGSVGHHSPFPYTQGGL